MSPLLCYSLEMFSSTILFRNIFTLIYLSFEIHLLVHEILLNYVDGTETLFTQSPLL